MPRVHDDVRMRGFRSRVTLQEALSRIAEAIAPLGRAEEVPLAEAGERILATEIRAPRAVPAFDRAAMDGFAVSAARTAAATVAVPVVLEIAGESLPARPFEGRLEGGRAVRIMTGAPMPEGADAVVPAEFATEARGCVRLAGPVAAGKHVGRAGEDLAAGEVALVAGRRLRPQDLGLLASVGRDRVPVAPRPRVGLLATGDEIAKAGAPLAPFQVHDANTPMLRGLVDRWGGTTAAASLQPDEDARLRRALGRLAARPDLDLGIVTGATSVGSEDRMPALLAEEGRLLFHGVSIRPAGPVGFGVIDRRPVFLLPGNPVSCLCAFDLLVGPALRRLQGLPPAPPYARVRVPLAARLASAAGRVDYARVALGPHGATPLSVSGASVLTSATRADGYVVVPAEVEAWHAGELVDVLLY